MADIRDKKRHGFLRRIANPLFSQTNLTQLEPIMRNYYSRFVSGIIREAQENGGIIDITKWVDHLAFDVCNSTFVSNGVDKRCHFSR